MSSSCFQCLALRAFRLIPRHNGLPRLAPLPRKQQVPEGSCEKVKIEFVIATVVNENTGAVGSDVTL